jgi:hypothetical protein
MNGTTVDRRPTHRDALASLLHAAGDTPLDAPTWAPLRCDARAVTARLAGAGRIPSHLVVASDDPPAVVARTLAAAWPHVMAIATPVPVGVDTSFASGVRGG